VVQGHKTGHFLDQRDNRLMVRGLATGARVLDVFACTGGFSVSAAAGGAVSVHAIDISRPALAAAEANMAANRHLPAVAACRFERTAGDAFVLLERLGRAGEQYDLVVVDPPSFAHRAADAERAVASYRRLTRLALPLVRPGGVLVQSSCSSRVDADTFVEAVEDEAWQRGIAVERQALTGHALDHPVTFREGAYLKTVVLRVRR
jgi:23S rRNA (cytosine1962-C5)-methyltransferase